MRSKLTALRAGPLQSAATLRAKVRAHLERAQEHAKHDAFLDLDAATSIAAALEHLLDDWAALDAKARSHAQSACLYFASDDDAEPDFDSVVGFDDDVEALNLVLDLIGRAHLRIEL